jgi:hypothetical protein
MAKQQIENIKQDFYDIYKVLTPSDNSIGLTKSLWDGWEKLDFTRPNVDDVAANTIKRDKQFFYEIIKIAEKVEKKDINIEYCPFIVGDYGLSILDATDGDLVLTDESFFGVLFFLMIVFMFDAYGFIKDEERGSVASFVNKLVDKYINHEAFDGSGDNITPFLMEKDYETTEFAIYFFQSMKIFLIAHEISHHILGHTKETATDKRSKIDEFEADKLGYKIFLETMNTTDDSIDVAYCKYRFEFAPLFLFDLCDRFDELKGKRATDSRTHPVPRERKENLLKHYEIKDPDCLYKDLVEIMKSNIGSVIKN